MKTDCFLFDGCEACEIFCDELFRVFRRGVGRRFVFPEFTDCFIEGLWGIYSIGDCECSSSKLSCTGSGFECSEISDNCKVTGLGGID